MVSTFDFDIPISPSIGDLESVCGKGISNVCFQTLFSHRDLLFHQSCCSPHSELFSLHIIEKYKTL
jgi:hypothetical protein